MTSFNKIKWIVDVILNLMDSRFTGTLMIDFHEGAISEKVRQQIVRRKQDFM